MTSATLETRALELLRRSFLQAEKRYRRLLQRCFLQFRSCKNDSRRLLSEQQKRESVVALCREVFYPHREREREKEREEKRCYYREAKVTAQGIKTVRLLSLMVSMCRVRPDLSRWAAVLPVDSPQYVRSLSSSSSSSSSN